MVFSLSKAFRHQQRSSEEEARSHPRGVSLQAPTKIIVDLHRCAYDGLQLAPLDRASGAPPRDDSPPPAVASRPRAVVWPTRLCPVSCGVDAGPSGPVSGTDQRAM